MSGQLTPVYPAETVYRVGRRPDPWAWPDWSQASPDGTFGNRWDDPLGSYRVLYASSQELGALVETLARFRPDLEVIAGLHEIDGDDDAWPAGAVPRSWLRDRTLGAGALNGAYADVGDARSIAFIREELAPRAIHHGLDEIDAATLRLRAPRIFTQEVSRRVYECRSERGEPFRGIRYRSRLGDQFVNWAVFEVPAGDPEPLTVVDVRPMAPDTPGVLEALDLLGLHWG